MKKRINPGILILTFILFLFNCSTPLDQFISDNNYENSIANNEGQKQTVDYNDESNIIELQNELLIGSNTAKGSIKSSPQGNKNNQSDNNGGVTLIRGEKDDNYEEEARVYEDFTREELITHAMELFMVKRIYPNPMQVEYHEKCLIELDNEGIIEIIMRYNKKLRDAMLDQRTLLSPTPTPTPTPSTGDSGVSKKKKPNTKATESKQSSSKKKTTASKQSSSNNKTTASKQSSSNNKTAASKQSSSNKKKTASKQSGSKKKTTTSKKSSSKKKK